MESNPLLQINVQPLSAFDFGLTAPSEVLHPHAYVNKIRAIPTKKGNASRVKYIDILTLSPEAQKCAQKGICNTRDMYKRYGL